MLKTVQKHSTVLHRAPLVVPVCEPVIEDGAVLVADGIIKKVDRFQRLKDISCPVVDHEEAVLLPAFMNCHAHLELSFLGALGQDNSFFEPGDITAWIYRLLHTRMELSGDTDANVEASRQALAAMHLSGIAAVADIGNDGASQHVSKDSLVQVQFFLEAFGLSSQEVPEVQKRLQAFDELSWTGHAPYSTSPELIQVLKERAKLRRELFPIHTAESADEIEFLQTGKGRFADFLGKRLVETAGALSPSIEDIFSPPGCGAITYLDQLGVLDSDTLCVHGVHLEDSEIDLLAQRGSSICLCPSSNDYLGVGKAPVAQLLEAGVLVCLGTDSLASNPRLSIWHEMKVLAQNNPSVSPEAVLQMATQNGARVLGLEDSFGGIQPGKSAALLAVRDVSLSRKQIYENLVTLGGDATVSWLGTL